MFPLKILACKGLISMYFTGRDATWTPSNKRPERLRDTLREVEVCGDTFFV